MLSSPVSIAQYSRSSHAPFLYLTPSTVSKVSISSILLQHHQASPFLDNSLQAYKHPSELTKAKHSFRYHPYLYDFLNIATFLRSNVKLPQSFSTLVSGLYSPVSLLFPHNRRVAIKICLKPFHDFPISLKIKLNPLTWPNRPYETSPCLPTTWTLSLVSHFSPSPRSLISLP